MKYTLSKYNFYKKMNVEIEKIVTSVITLKKMVIIMHTK
jgi:hypothetical protein